MHITTPRSHRRRRTGFALAFTLLAMTVLGALAGGVFFVTLRESRDARDALRRVRAVSAAEFGVYTVAASSVWNPFWNTTPQRGLVDARTYQPGDGSLDSVQVWKLSPSDFRVASEGYSGSGAARARHRVSLLLSLRGPHLVPRAVALVKEQATLSGDARLSGAPPVLLDSLASDSRMHEQFGTFTRGQIAALGRALPIGAELLNPAPVL